MERQEPGRGERLRLLAKKYIVMPKGKAMEKDGRRSFQNFVQLAQITAVQILPPHAYKLLQDWDNEDCKRPSAKCDACLLDLVALGAPQRVTGISDEARKQ
jgi:hypothetical protein